MEENKNNIISFLAKWGDECIYTPIVNNIQNIDVSECSEEKECNVKFLFCDNDPEKNFWKRHIEDYLELYIYASLYVWAYEIKDKTIIARKGSYWESYKEDICKQMESFLKNRNEIPNKIFIGFAFMIDECLWKNKNIPPKGYAMLTEKHQKEFYHKYTELLERTIKNTKNAEIRNNIDSYLIFCITCDRFGQTECLSILDNTVPIVGKNKYDFDFKTSQKILAFICEYRNRYKIDDGVIIEKLQNLVSRRILDYILGYRSFLDEKKCKICREEYTSMTENEFSIWKENVFPWNFIAYKNDGAINEFYRVFEKISNEIYACCRQHIDDVVQEARDALAKDLVSESGRVHLEFLLEEKTLKFFLPQRQDLRKKLIKHLCLYKENKCVEIVKNALKDVNTTKYINQFVEKAGLDQEPSVLCKEKIAMMPNEESYSKISIKIGGKVLFSHNFDRNKAFVFLDSISSCSLPGQYYEIVSNVWIHEPNLFHFYEKNIIEENISKEQEDIYMTYIADYVKTLKDDCIHFIRRYLEYEYEEMIRKKMPCDNRTDSSDDNYYTNNWLWDHGY